MNLQQPSTSYKPFLYEWAVKAAKEHEAIHWTEEEIDLGQDLADWKNGNLSQVEIQHITSILQLFTQLDVSVGQNYYDYLIPTFKNNEINLF